MGIAYGKDISKGLSIVIVMTIDQWHGHIDMGLGLWDARSLFGA
jgi:uncharacterized protein YwbE